MRRAAAARRGLALAALAVGGALAATASEAPDGARAGTQVDDRPNVVIIQTDDQRLDELSAMPTVRRLLGGRGTTFSRYLATTPLCCPSRATLLTGQYTHNHGVVSNNAATGGGYPSLDHSRTLPVWLERAGYTTGHVGKYLNGYDGPPPPGWTEFYGTLAGTASLMYGYRLNENGDVVQYGEEPEDYQTDVLADHALSFVERRAPEDEPFFLAFNPSAPHTESRARLDVGPQLPRNPRPAPRHVGRYEQRELPKPPAYNERDVSDKPSSIRSKPRIKGREKRRIRRRHRSRLESLRSVDEAVGSLVRKLEDAGELDRTVIVFVSDNGYFRGEHRLAGGKGRLYTEAVHVPLIVRGPGFPAGAERSQLTGNVDLAPTILDVAEARARGRTVDGRSLTELAASPRRGRSRELLLEEPLLRAVGLRTDRYVYIEHERRERELYDMRADPHQLESLHRSRRHRGLQRRLADRLASLRGCEGRECR